MSRAKDRAKSRNILTFIPVRAAQVGWHTEEDGRVTLEVENTGMFNFIAQKLFHKPRISQIHLDENGSFVWSVIDGESDILALGKLVDARFGEEAAPLYPRLAKFFQVMQSYGFVTLRDPEGAQ